MDNATTSEQHTGRQRSDSAEPDSDGFPRRTSLRETDLSHPAKGGFHPCFCLPACCNCPVALSEFATLILMIQLYLNWTISKHAIAAGKPDSKIIFASQMWAARPHLASIFEKLLEQKTFCLPAARYLKTMLLKKTVFRVRQKGVPPLLLPTSMLQLPRCLV